MILPNSRKGEGKKMKINVLGSRGRMGVPQKTMPNSESTYGTFTQSLSQNTKADSVPRSPKTESNSSTTGVTNAAIHSPDFYREVKVQKGLYASENVQFSGSYQERLAQLSKLNAETDWASMSDVEKVKTFEDRYRQAFQDDKFFISAGLYAPYSKQHKEMYESYLEEEQKYFGKEGPAKTKAPYTTCYKEAYYGNKTDEEVRAAIREKWEGSESLEDRFTILEEYARCGVSAPANTFIQWQIESDIFRKVESVLNPTLRATGRAINEHPRFSEYFMTYAKGVGEGAGFKPNWTQIVESVWRNLENAPGINTENAMTSKDLEEIRNSLDDFLNEVLGRDKN